MTLLLLATNVPSLFAVLAMNTSGGMGISVVLNARLGIEGRKVSYHLSLGGLGTLHGLGAIYQLEYTLLQRASIIIHSSDL